MEEGDNPRDVEALQGKIAAAQGASCTGRGGRRVRSATLGAVGEGVVAEQAVGAKGHKEILGNESDWTRPDSKTPSKGRGRLRKMEDGSGWPLNQLRDLHRIERGTLQELVAHHPEGEAV